VFISKVIFTQRGLPMITQNGVKRNTQRYAWKGKGRPGKP